MKAISDESGLARIRMANSVETGEVVLCVAHKGGAQNMEERPSEIIRLSADGREISRTSAAFSGLEGGPLYAISACLPWGEGYAVIANEKRPHGSLDDYGKPSSWPYRNVLIRLRKDFSVLWRRPLALHANPLGATGGPRVQPNGDLVIAGTDRLFRVDGAGSVRAQSEIGSCQWLRTASSENLSRLACARLQNRASSTILEYGEMLNVVHALPLGHSDVGVPVVCQSTDSTFALLGNNGSDGPFVQTYSGTGRELGKYEFPNFASEGAVIDGVAIGASRFAVVRYIDHEGRFTTVVSWLIVR